MSLEIQYGAVTVRGVGELAAALQELIHLRKQLDQLRAAMDREVAEKRRYRIGLEGIVAAASPSGSEWGNREIAAIAREALKGKS